jgi:hypothetical protein
MLTLRCPCLYTCSPFGAHTYRHTHLLGTCAVYALLALLKNMTWMHLIHVFNPTWMYPSVHFLDRGCLPWCSCGYNHSPQFLRSGGIHTDSEEHMDVTTNPCAWLHPWYYMLWMPPHGCNHEFMCVVASMILFLYIMDATTRINGWLHPLEFPFAFGGCIQSPLEYSGCIHHLFVTSGYIHFSCFTKVDPSSMFSFRVDASTRSQTEGLCIHLTHQNTSWMHPSQCLFNMANLLYHNKIFKRFLRGNI